jgi:hypothetical protein
LPCHLATAPPERTHVVVHACDLPGATDLSTKACYKKLLQKQKPTGLVLPGGGRVQQWARLRCYGTSLAPPEKTQMLRRQQRRTCAPSWIEADMKIVYRTPEEWGNGKDLHGCIEKSARMGGKAAALGVGNEQSKKPQPIPSRLGRKGMGAVRFSLLTPAGRRRWDRSARHSASR